MNLYLIGTNFGLKFTVLILHYFQTQKVHAYYFVMCGLGKVFVIALDHFRAHFDDVGHLVCIIIVFIICICHVASS